MSFNYERIFGLLENIINESKAKYLLLYELKELLTSLNNSKNGDGVKLFIDEIENRSTSEKEKILKFLIPFLADFSIFPLLVNYITSEKTKFHDIDIILPSEVKETSTKAELLQGDELESKIVDSLDELKEKTADKLDDGEDKVSDIKPKISSEEVSRSIPSSEIKPDADETRSKSIPQVQPASKPISPPSALPSPSPAPASPSKFGADPSVHMKKSIIADEQKQERRKEITSERSKKNRSSVPMAPGKVNTKGDESTLDDSELVETGKRGVLIDYFSRMNINEVYDFTVKIDKEILEAKKKQSDIFTGEQREQTTDEITVVEDLPIEVELQVPGSIVSPPIHYVSPEAQSSTVTFYVTPYVKFSKKTGFVTIGQKKIDRKVINLKISVIDRRMAKILSLIGVLIAAIPSIWPYLFNVDMNNLIVTSIQTHWSVMTTQIMLGIELLFGGVVTLGSLLSLRLYSSKRSSLMSTEAF